MDPIRKKSFPKGCADSCFYVLRVLVQVVYNDCKSTVC